MAAPTERFLQLYIFEKAGQVERLLRGESPQLLSEAPRCLPPYVDLQNLTGDSLVRAVRRAALHPWRDARFWRRAAEHVSALDPQKLPGRDLAQVCLAFKRVDFPSTVLSQHCQQYVQSNYQNLNTFELAAVLSYFCFAGAGLSGIPTEGGLNGQLQHALAIEGFAEQPGLPLPSILPHVSHPRSCMLPLSFDILQIYLMFISLKLGFAT